MKNKILCVLQVRGGSKGVPKKNIREVNGKPLMTWTIESAKKSRVFDSIWVSSDFFMRLDLHLGSFRLSSCNPRIFKVAIGWNPTARKGFCWLG